MTRRSARIRLVPVLLSLLLAALFAASPASAVDLDPVADTYIRHGTNEGNNYGTNSDMYLYQKDNQDKDFLGYIRFDLSVLGAGFTVSDATLTLTKVDASRDDTINAGRFALFGLEDHVGNTAQDWSQTSLKWNNAGDEADDSIYSSGDPAAGLSPLDLGRVTNLDDDAPAGIVETFNNVASGDPKNGGTVVVTGQALIDFLQDRVDAVSDSGLATFIVDFPTQGNNSGRGYGLGTTDHGTSAYHPKLTVETTAAVCGNDSIETGEECDDGGTSPGDCCSATCQIEVSDPLCSGSTPPTVTETGSAITVDNGLLSFQVDKSDGSISSLVLGGQELLGGGGILYQDANDDAYWRLGDSTPASYSVTTGVDFVDVALSTAADAEMPADFTLHYVLREGEPGLHIYLEINHTTAMADLDMAQTRAVLRADPSLFDHHSVTDTRSGPMPTPAELAAGTGVSDATTQLNPGTAYEAETGRSVYTKYDWSLDEGSREVIGMTGDDYGAWVVESHQESHPGGPWKQHMTAHQTESTPVLLLMWASTHYGTHGRTVLSGNESRVYGPKYLHFNTGASLSAMRTEAKAWNDRSLHRSFYDGLGIPGWTTTANLADVSGDLSIAGSGPLENATIILSEDGEDFQFSRRGYVYYTTTDASGDFLLDDVRPGSYRLSAVAPGIYGEFIVDGVVVSAGTPLDLGSLAWTPPDFGSDLWQIGTFDRSAEEYLHGSNDDYRRWGLWFDYPTEFPSDVHFVIGTSDEAVDWNYAHFERTSTTPSPTCTASATSPEWEVEFSGAGVPANRLATLTVAVAGQRGADLEVRLNGDFVGTWALPHDGSIIHRSGIRGAYQSHQFTFDTDLVQAGTNTLTLRHTSAGSSCTEGILYDALRLEIGGELSPIVVLTPEADAAVLEHNPTSNIGANEQLQIRSRSVVDSERQSVSFVRFSLASVADVAALTDAKLEFESINNSCTGGGCSLQLYGLDDALSGTGGNDWDETTINYDNAPTIPGDGNAGTQDLDTTNLTLLDTFNVESSGVSTNWTPEMLAFLQADTDGQVTFVLYESENGDRNVYFATKEHATAMAPTLTVTDEGLLSTCGDSLVEGTEQCDDGGTSDGDGCSATCQFETGACDDGLFCTSGETWSAGVCEGGTAVTGDDGVTCTDDSCDEVNDVIVNAVNHANCDNGAFCDGSETCHVTLDCQDGADPVASDGVTCTDDSCDEVNDVIVNAVNDANCDNGAFCDGSETCHATLDCQAGTSPTADDSVGCTDDSCDEVNDIIVNAANDANCDNGQFCDGSETCHATLDCQDGADPVASDEVSCTDDSCDEVNDVIVNAVNHGYCDDGNECTTDICSAATSCTNEPILECSAAVPAGSPRTHALVIALLLTTAIMTFRAVTPRP